MAQNLFLSTLSLRRATPAPSRRKTTDMAFLSTLSLRRATNRNVANGEREKFLSTLSLRRATSHPTRRQRRQSISIHALLTESDGRPKRLKSRRCVFLSTLSLRRATNEIANQRKIDQFLSTLSLRRATAPSHSLYLHNRRFLSTLSLRRATRHWQVGQKRFRHFYPRSPYGERLKRFLPMCIIRHFYPRSPYGERREREPALSQSSEFLSTLSLRRATHYDNYNLHCVEISIHALLTESDLGNVVAGLHMLNFYPRSPYGERLVGV